jgi:hypothetical protein
MSMAVATRSLPISADRPVLATAPLRPGFSRDDLSRYSDAIWDLGPAVFRENARRCHVTAHFEVVPDPAVARCLREYLYVRLNVDLPGHRPRLPPAGLRQCFNENGLRQPQKTSLAKIIQVLERRGIEFTEHEGVRFKANAVEVYEGAERFDDFYEALYVHLAQHGGAVCMSVTDERLLAQYRKDPDLHRKRMKELADTGRITFRVLAAQGNFTSAYADYRRPTLPVPPPTSFYAFGDCLALISFVHDNPPYVVLIQSAPLAPSADPKFCGDLCRITYLCVKGPHLRK